MEFKVKGVLNKSFIGLINYETVIEDVKKLRIKFNFTNRKVYNDSLENISAIKNTLSNNNINIDDETIKEVIDAQKTELQILVYNNDTFIGTAHRDEDVKDILISEEESSLGFRKTSIDKGVLKIIVNVVEVMADDTEYELMVSV